MTDDDAGEPRRYRKKPLEVTAIRWTGENLSAVAGLIGYGDLRDLLPRGAVRPVLFVDHLPEPPVLWMTTVHGEAARARVGDYVIPEPLAGHAYPVTGEIFAATYDEISEEQHP